MDALKKEVNTSNGIKQFENAGGNYKMSYVLKSNVFCSYSLIHFRKYHCLQVNELRCVEQKLSRQNEMIRTPISDLGCEQAPPGFEVEKTEDFASLSSGSAGGTYLRLL